MNMQRGFTLIELLVVIAIIALLASIVLASVTAAKNQAYDNAVKAGLKQLAAQIESVAGSGSFSAGLSGTGPWNCSTTIPAASYCTLAACANSTIFSDNSIQRIFANIADNDPNATIKCSIDVTGNKWAVSVTRLRSSATAWCIDNSGDIKSSNPSAGACL